MSLTDKIITFQRNLQQIPKLVAASSRKSRIIALSATCLTLVAFGAAGIAPITIDPNEIAVKAISTELLLPSLEQQVAKLEAQQQLYVAEDKMRASDTLASLLIRLGVEDSEANDFIKLSSRSVLQQFKPGTLVQVKTNNDGELETLHATLFNGAEVPSTNLLIQRKGNHFQVSTIAATIERRVEMHTGVISSSLFAATDAANIPDAIASQIVAMFGTNINFASDLQRGDHFNVAYETFWQNGQFLRTGRILAGEFVNAGKPFHAVWFDEPGNSGYYSFDGKSLKKAFLKSPIVFTRISSGFAMRLHPIQGRWKKHNGVDFAAPTGTPIHATADGTIDFAGVQNGYGNVVIIKHDRKYTTLYGHMSRFAAIAKKGSKVRQGEVIGYVGMTGWATGPHLHYEFHIANQPRDPLSAAVVPVATPLTGTALQRFRNVTADITHRFNLLSGNSTTLAMLSK